MRKGCPDVWVFRWYDYSSGKRIYKKQIIGSVGQFRNTTRSGKGSRCTSQLDLNECVWGLAFWFAGVNSFLGDERSQDLLEVSPERVVAAARDEMAEVQHV
jgi:hypothetical protein